jgi:cell division protein FtsI (penicillin-binding protein 3)
MKQAHQSTLSRWVKHARASCSGSDNHDAVSFQGAQKKRMQATRMRVVLAGLAFLSIYGVIGARLIHLAATDSIDHTTVYNPEEAIAAARPQILDRQGELLATDVKAVAVYAEPRRMVDVDEAIFQLASILPDLDRDRLRQRLSDRKSAFQWIEREITPPQRDAIHALGIPGIGFFEEARRFYPGGALASHILGSVDVDNKGIAGVERYLDTQGLNDLQSLGFARDTSQSMQPVRLSVDMRVQHVVRDELAEAMERYSAIAAIGIVMDVHTGEVVAMSSLPDYDSNDRQQALNKDRLNRATAGVFEMGSIFKVFTTAAALDSGRVTMSDSFDATRPIRVGRKTINDFHAKRRVLSVPEVFIYSSNIGTAKMALELGIEGQKDYWSRLGLLERPDIELPESARPLLPPKWNELAAMTISFGHGISVAPLQVAAACAAMVNGGLYITPTFFPRDEVAAQQIARRILKPETSDAMRYLMRLNVEKGSGRRADVEGMYVGGKTGTAEKVVNGVYDGDKRLNSFLATFPADDPQYVVLVTIDEPQPEEGKHSATAGLNAAPTAGAIIDRIGPMLGVVPRLPSTVQESGMLEVSFDR